jgi:hypothetical protein
MEILVSIFAASGGLYGSLPSTPGFLNEGMVILIPEPALAITNAISIHALPEKVWHWPV